MDNGQGTMLRRMGEYMDDSSKAPNNAWKQVRVATDEPGLTRIDFKFAPGYLKSFSKLDSRIRTRGPAPSFERERILLEDVVELPGGPAYFWAWLVPSKKPDGMYHIRLKVLAPSVVRQNVTVILYWGGGEFRLPLQAKSSVYEIITLGNYSLHYDNLPAGRLGIRVEHRDQRMHTRKMRI